MKTIYLDKDMPSCAPCAATIGFFDGVHLGHRFLIEQVKDEARRKGLESTVITFDRHPREVLQTDYRPRLLCTQDEKLILLARTGIDNVVILPFSREMAALTAGEFMKSVLYEQLSVRHLVIGYDHRFGRNRAEGFEDYRSHGAALGMSVQKAEAYVQHGMNVSSSVVRELLAEGDLARANECLGYPYTVSGTVVHGEANGRKMGFPTANIDLGESRQLLPATGVYAIRARVKSSMSFYRGMLNIGYRPTFGGTSLSVEAHIFNWSDDLYGQPLYVSFVQRIRSEQKFESMEALEARLHEDKRMVEQIFEERHEE